MVRARYWRAMRPQSDDSGRGDGSTLSPRTFLGVMDFYNLHHPCWLIVRIGRVD